MKDKNTLRINDAALVGILLLIGIIMLIAVYVLREKGDRVQVRVDGNVTAEYRLGVNGRYLIEGYKDGRNTLIIENGEAYVEEANCPDGLCEKMGRISAKGQSVICLPNRVVVEIISG